MGASIPILVLVVAFHLIAFVLAVGAERRRSTVPFCSICSDQSWVLFLFLLYLYLIIKDSIFFLLTSLFDVLEGSGKTG